MSGRIGMQTRNKNPLEKLMAALVVAFFYGGSDV